MCMEEGECEITYDREIKTKTTKLSGEMTFDYIVPKTLRR